MSKYNSLGGGRYFDPEAGLSWAFDYVTGVSQIGQLSLLLSSVFASYRHACPNL